MEIVKEVLIQAPLKAVYDAYAFIQGWKEVLGDVVGIHVYYDDGKHQEFDMTVQRGNTQETVHAIRFCYPRSSIEMFQTQPPPLFKSMSGVWKFVPQGQGVLVQAMRKFELKSEGNFDILILEQFLEKNLTSFKKWIEKI